MCRRQPPIKGAELFFHGDHASEIHPPRSKPLPRRVRHLHESIGLNKGFHGLSQIKFIGQMRAILIIADLVLEEPSKFTIETRTFGIVAQSIIAQQRNAIEYPTQTILRTAHHHADVVSKVPGIIGPVFRSMRIEKCNPARQLHQF